MTKQAVFWVALIVFLDQILKSFAMKLGLVVFYNQKLFFGLINYSYWEQLAAYFLIGGLVFYWWRKKEIIFLLEKVGFLFLIGGGLSNQIDRWRYGAVIDFIDLKIWPVFNLADALITLGLFLLINSHVRAKNYL